MNKCPNIKLNQEIIDYVNEFSSDEHLLRGGGLPNNLLDKAAFGVSEDIKQLMPDQLKIRWHDDLENVKWEIEQQGLTDEQWAKYIDLTEPIEVEYWKNEEEGFEEGFYISDGHHRYYAAKTLEVPLNVDLEIKVNPIEKLAPGIGYDNFHRCLFKQVREESGYKEISRSFLKQFVNNVNNRAARDFVKGWSEREGGDKVWLSPKEYFILKGIKRTGSIPKTSVNENNIKDIVRSDAAFDILDSSNCAGTDWGAGGCAILAQALHKLEGYPMVVIYNLDYEGPEHFGVMTPEGSIIDHDGEHKSSKSWIKFFKENEYPREGALTVSYFTPDMNMNGIKFDDEAANKLANLIKSRKMIREIVRGVLSESYNNIYKNIESNKYYPKIPVVDVFFNDNIHKGGTDWDFERIIRKDADKYSEDDKFKSFPIETIDIKKIVPTQKFLNINNLKSVRSDDKNTGAYLSKYNGYYYILDGHHRIANKILEGDKFIKAYVYDNEMMSENVTKNLSETDFKDTAAPIRYEYSSSSPAKSFVAKNGEKYKVFIDKRNTSPGSYYGIIVKTPGHLMDRRDAYGNEPYEVGGDTVGYLFLNKEADGVYRSSQTLSNALWVKEDLRRQGIATAMHDYANKVIGVDTDISDTASPEAKSFWGSRKM